MEIPLITTLTAAQAAVNGIRWLGQKEFAGALCGWGCRAASFRLSANEGSYSKCVALVKRGWKDHIDPDQCDALLTRGTRHPHGDPADHNADGRTSRG